MKGTVYGALALALLLVGSSLLTAATTVQDLRIGGYTLVGKTRISRFHYHLAYTAKLTNGGTTAISGATAKLRPFLDILIVDGQLSFGPVAAGQTITSTDTFTLRWPTERAIDPRLLERLLRWNITIANAAPIANAGPDQTVPLGSTVVLDGTGSSDADGDPLTYRWAITAKPPGSTAALTAADTATPAFVIDRPGSYDVKLVVNDGQSDSTPDTVRISTANSAPSADAGPDQTAFVGNTVTLDGTASTDVDGDPITYQWSFTTKPAGSQAALSDPTVARPSFTVDKPGDYFIQLIVNDGKADSAPDSVQVSTQNSAPVANAGPDQGVFVNTAVQLDGSQSSDADGDALTYRWSLLNRPASSAAVLANDQAVNPSFTVDKPGSYTVQLIVNDGTADSAPDQIVVSTQNSRPVANAGADQTAVVGDPVTLDGNGSLDADGDNLSFAWSLITRPANSTAALTGADAATPTFIPDQAGDYTAQLIVDDGQLASPPDTALVTVSVPPPPNQAPSITSTAITTGQSGSLYTYQVIATDPDGDPPSYALTTFPAGMTISAGGLIDWTPASAGNFDVTVEVSDGRGGSARQSFTINVTAAPVAVPDVVGLTESQATTSITTVGLVVGTVTRSNSDSVPAGDVISQSPAAGTQVAAGSAVDLVVSLGPVGGLPPDPATVAPPVDPGVATILSRSTEFLYTGPNPIQTGVAPGTIQPVRAAVIRGKVLDKNDQPLSGVTITVLNHPEFGQTLSRADGIFDLAVNGGGPLTVNYAKAGYLPAQRPVNAPWQDFVMADDVVMIAADPAVTTVDFSAAVPMQVARGSAMTDADGTRRATVLIPQGTVAQIYRPDGTTQPVGTLNLRFTEYTVGPNGPASMPAPLPPTSAYTYAVELGADEATTKIAGKDVLFNQPVYLYLENFLGIPTGIQVPVGYYDRDKAAWVPSPDGRIIKILSITSGLADLDTDGDGTVDNGTAIGVTAAERTQLASLYAAGQSLERIPIHHFSTYDPNYGVSPAAGSSRPSVPVARSESQEKQDCANRASGSIIECENQILGESLPITGTPYSLNYRSDRVPGRKAGNTLEIPLSGATVPAPLQRIDLEIRVAGRTIRQTFPAAPNQTYTLTWDGKDAYGRDLNGLQPVAVRIGYVYPGFYNLPPSMAASFGAQSGTPIPGNVPARDPATLWQEYSTSMGTWDASDQGLAGWTLGVHHAYDAAGKVLYLGTGERRSANTISGVTTVAGNGTSGFGGDGAPATAATFGLLSHLDIGPDGSLYLPDGANNRIRRIWPNGVITTIVGTGIAGYSGDGGPATAAALNVPTDVALGPDGVLYILDALNNRIRRVRIDGVINTVAGNGVRGTRGAGDGGPATSASLNSPQAIEVGVDGSLYISEPDFGGGALEYRIRKVGLDGIITTVAGGGSFGPNYTANRPATSVYIDTVFDMATAPNGSLYIAEASHNIIRRVDPDGTISPSIAGNPFSVGFSGDGGPAVLAKLRQPIGLAFRNGTLYINDVGNSRVRVISPDGIIRTVAGNGQIGYSGDGGPTLAATFNNATDLAVGPDGSLYIADSRNFRIRRLGPVLPGFKAFDIAIPSEDGTELYQFDSTGRHLRTLNALTGATLSQFGYDTGGRLFQITDGDGNVTTIQRDASGNPTAVAGPFGQRTTFILDANGYLAVVTNPVGEPYAMTYTADGLLTGFTDPRSNGSTMTYDALGRLLKDENAAGGSQSLARTELANGYEAKRTTALNRTTTHRVEFLSTGDQRRTDTFPDGTTTATLNKTEGTRQTTLPDGSVTTLVEGPDPRFSMQAPIPKSLITATGGRTLTLTTARTAALGAPANPLSLTRLTDTITLNGRVSTGVYDAATKTTTSTSAAGRQSTLVIDGLGRPTQAQVAALLAVNTTYDTKGRLSSITQGTGPDGRTVNFNYDPSGYLQTVTDPLNRTVNYQYDAAGRVTRQVLPDGREIFYGYDAKGNLNSITPPGRPAHVFAYTRVDQTAEYLPPPVAGTGSTLYAYDLDKQLTRITRPDGALLDFGYDSAGRLNTLTIPTGVLSYAYDPTTGKLTTITAPDGGTLTYSYSGALLTQTAWAGTITGSVGRSYDNDFRVTSLTVNGANSVAFGYDADSLLTTAGALTLNRSAQNGLLTGTALDGVTDTLTYSGFGEVTHYSAKFNATEIFGTQYSYDKLGRITQKVERLGIATNTFDYGYDLAGRLTEVKQNGAVTPSYTYDGNGNRLSGPGLLTPPAYDDQDRLINYGGTAYTYTANGELASKTTGAFITTYQYDVLGNLKHVTLPSGTQIDYAVDGNNRRIGKKVGGTLVQGFLYQDQLKPIAELDGNNNVTSRFVYATHANVPDYIVMAGVTYRIITDHLGSPRLVVNATDGTVIQRMDYDEFGRVILDTNPGFQPFGFAGGLYDRDTKLVRFGARDYDAEAGRWTAKDPIMFESGRINLYGYAINNPTNRIDPLGSEDVTWLARRYGSGTNITDIPNYNAPYNFVLGISGTFGLGGVQVGSVGLVINTGASGGIPDIGVSISGGGGPGAGASVVGYAGNITGKDVHDAGGIFIEDSVSYKVAGLTVYSDNQDYRGSAVTLGPSLRSFDRLLPISGAHSITNTHVYSVRDLMNFINNLYRRCP